MPFIYTYASILARRTPWLGGWCRKQVHEARNRFIWTHVGLKHQSTQSTLSTRLVSTTNHDGRDGIDRVDTVNGHTEAGDGETSGYRNISLNFNEDGMPYDLDDPDMLYTSKYRNAHQTLKDRLSVFIRAGKGGTGSGSRIGGRGGSVWAASHLRARLADVPNTVLGTAGTCISKTHIISPAVEDHYINVPLGTVIYLTEGRHVCPITERESARLIFVGELNEPNQKILLCTGGLGGSVASETTSPEPASHPKTIEEAVDTPNSDYNYAMAREIKRYTRSCPGLPGEARRFVFELKMIADVGLVGFPNAGKSSLLHVLSRAKPRIGHYPFTTLRPTLGHLDFGADKIVTIADIPGIIEGAHANLGLGHRFLKHIERTKALIYLIDIHGFSLNLNDTHKTALETLKLLKVELEMHEQIGNATNDPVATGDAVRQSFLSTRPSLIVINKLDDPDSLVKYHELEAEIRALTASDFRWAATTQVLGVSLKTGYNVETLRAAIHNLIYAQQ